MQSPAFLCLILAFQLLIMPWAGDMVSPNALLAVYGVSVFVFLAQAVTADRIVLFRIPKTALALLMAALVVILCRPSDVASQRHLAQFILGFGAIFLAASQVDGKETAEKLVGQLAATAVACFYIAYALTLLGVGTGVWIGAETTPPWDFAPNHRFGLFGSHQATGTIGTLALIGTLFLWNQERVGARGHLFLAATTALIVLALIASQTRTAYWVLLTVPVAVLAYRTRLPASIMTIGAAAIIAGLVALLFVPTSVIQAIVEPMISLAKLAGVRLVNTQLIGAEIILTGRAALWTGLIHMIQDSPLIGLGKDLPYGEYNVSKFALLSPEALLTGETAAAFGGNDSGLTVAARYGLPFSVFFLACLVAPAFSIRDRRIRVLAHQIASSVLVFWLLNGSFQFLYLTDASFITAAAALSACSWYDRARPAPAAAERARSDPGAAASRA